MTTKEKLQEIKNPINETIYPFSCGTDAMNWLDNNCDNCENSACARLRDFELDIVEAEEWAMKGKECMAKIALDYGFFSGDIPMFAYEFIWPKGQISGHIKCRHFEKLKPQKKPKYSNRIIELAKEFLTKQIAKATGKKKVKLINQLENLTK